MPATADRAGISLQQRARVRDRAHLFMLGVPRVPLPRAGCIAPPQAPPPVAASTRRPPGTGRQTQGDGVGGDLGPWRRREGAGAPMGATEAGGTKSGRLLSVLRRWCAGRRLRRLRSALRSGAGECARGGHWNRHCRFGRSSATGTPRRSQVRGPQTLAGQGRVCRLGFVLGKVLGDTLRNLT